MDDDAARRFAQLEEDLGPAWQANQAAPTPSTSW
jgi:hypothetical protein